MPQTFVLKLGGSIISPNPELIFDFPYAKKLKKLLSQFVLKGDKFFIAVGGGAIMRHYRDLAIANGLTEKIDLHWIGTTVNVLNAEVVRVSMQELADPGVYKFEDYYDGLPLTITKGIKVGGGGRPGHSGDVDAILVAQKLGIKKVISLKNIDAIYTADPKIDPDAKPLKHISWDGYLDIIGNPAEHTPGANFPIDSKASGIAKENGIKFVIIDGRNLENLKNLLQSDLKLLDKSFHGTVVE
jgi:uridylate kinase